MQSNSANCGKPYLKLGIYDQIIKYLGRFYIIWSQGIIIYWLIICSGIFF